MDKILLVDGSVQNTEIMSQCLENGEFEVMTAGSGSNALARIGLFLPDLVLIDADLPDVSGFDLCKQIKADFPHIFVLIVASKDSREARIRAGQVGADDFIEKTFDSFLLISKIKAILHLKHLKDKLKNQYAELEEKTNIINMQMKMGLSIQRSMLPKVDLNFHGVSIYSKYMPALDVGGDFYDVFVIDKDSVFVAIGDVSGHGIAAALLTSMLNLMVKNITVKTFVPNQILFELNKEFHTIFEHATQSMYACVFCAVINTSAKKIQFANAGATLPVFISEKRMIATELFSSGVPIGLMEKSKYELKEVEYEENDLLLFFTDGLPDFFYKENPDEFYLKLKETLLEMKSGHSSAEIVDTVVANFYNQEKSESSKLEIDDVSIILCKM